MSLRIERLSSGMKEKRSLALAGAAVAVASSVSKLNVARLVGCEVIFNSC